MWSDLTKNHSLINVTNTSLCKGPSYTYSSGENRSFVDYVIVNHDAFRGTSSCSIYDDHPLNTSDHLPIHIELDVPAITDPPTELSL